jgi:hypothetical protein
MSEHDDQVCVIAWARRSQGRLPELALLYAIPNGAKLPYQKDARGKRFSRQAMLLKAEGLTSGVPDLCLPVARGGYHGLYLEMKYGTNTTSEAQDAWIEALRSQGYFVQVAYGYDQATQCIEAYLQKT